MKRSSKALRMAQPLAVVAVWAGLLGYVIPAAFSTAPTVSATAASSASRRAAGTLEKGSTSPDRRSLSPAQAQQRHPGPAMVRVMQAALRPHRVSVTLGRQPLSHDQAFASITPYRSVHPGTWTVRAAGAGQRASIRVTLVAGSRTTLVVLADRSHLVISAPDISPGGTTVAAAASGPPRAGPGPPLPRRSPAGRRFRGWCWAGPGCCWPWPAWPGFASCAGPAALPRTSGDAATLAARQPWPATHRRPVMLAPT